jgi:formylglycine-generating enzyme required for sulfatase activity
MPEVKRPLKVFLCHASADKPNVRELYRYLRRRGVNPWFDEENLIGGQDWQVEIPKALATSDAIIICLTKNSVDKEGYIQKEIKFALDKALEMPEGRIFLIPVKFEECEVPFALSRYQWVDLTIEAGYSKMMKALKFRASHLERSTVELSKKIADEEKAEREEAENAARERAEREESERVAKENAEREVAEKDAKEKAEREAAEKADREKEVVENAKREWKEKEVREKQARETNEGTKQESEKLEKVTPKKAMNEPVASKPKANSPIAYWLGGFAVLVVGIAFLSSLNNPSQFSEPTPKNTQFSIISTPTHTKAVEPSATSTPELTSIPVSTLISTPLPTVITDAKGVSMMLVSGNNFESFYMDKYEVTNEFYKDCVDTSYCSPPIMLGYYTESVYSNHPVVYVNQEMAKTYCEWRDARLPTETEWEMASEFEGVQNYYQLTLSCEFANLSKTIRVIEPNCQGS